MRTGVANKFIVARLIRGIAGARFELLSFRDVLSLGWFGVVEGEICLWHGGVWLDAFHGEIVITIRGVVCGCVGAGGFQEQMSLVFGRAGCY